MLVFVPGLFEAFEAPKIGLVRVLGAAVLGAALAARRRPSAPLDLALLAWLAVEGLATALSTAPAISVAGDPSQREGLLTSVGLFGCWLAAREATRGARGPGRAAWIRAALVAAVTLASVYALVQAAQLDWLRWGRVATYGPDQSLVRPFGTLGHPNLLGAITAAALCLSLERAWSLPARRWMWGPLALLFAATTLLTFSRGAWLAALAGAGTTALLLAIARGRGVRDPAAAPRRRGRRVFGIVVAIAAVALFALTGWGTLFRERFADLLSPTRSSGSSRIEILRTGWAMALARPLVGQGPDTFGMHFARFQTPEYWRYEYGGVAVQAHSVPLHVLATRGAFGLAALLACVAAFLLALARGWRRPGADRAALAGFAGAPVAIAVSGAFGAVGITGALLALVCAAVVAGASDSPESASTASPATPHRLSAAWAASLAALAMAAYVASEMTASHAAAQALGRLRSRSPGAAFPFADRAARWAPFDDSMLRLRADARYAAAQAAGGDRALLAAAESDARAAVARAPWVALGHQRVALVAAARAAQGEPGAVDTARAAYVRALERAPVSAYLLIERSRFERGAGDLGAAARFARRATDLYPGDALAWLAAAECAVARGERESLRVALDRALAGDWHGRAPDRARAEAARALLE